MDEKLIWWAIKMLADDTKMSINDVQNAYNAVCQIVGITAEINSISEITSKNFKNL